MKNQPIVALKPDDEAVKVDWYTLGWFAIVHLVALIGPFFFFSWGAVAAMGVLYVLTSTIGITLGYHRLLTHRSFKTPRWVERTLATVGLLAFPSSPLEWVGLHRMHHAFVDTPKDPHNARRGFWWSHIGWMIFMEPALRNIPLLRKYARDIVADPYLNAMTGILPQFVLQIMLGLALFAFGGVDYVVWGIFVRCALVYHVTFFVNSATHKFGYRSHDSSDLSTNNWWVAILASGEGWHNNHHAEPDVARAGREWWELDITYGVILLMEAVGLAYDIKQPAPALEPVPASNVLVLPVAKVAAATDEFESRRAA